MSPRRNHERAESDDTEERSERPDIDVKIWNLGAFAKRCGLNGNSALLATLGLVGYGYSSAHKPPRTEDIAALIQKAQRDAAADIKADLDARIASSIDGVKKDLIVEMDRDLDRRFAPLNDRVAALEKSVAVNQAHWEDLGRQISGLAQMFSGRGMVNFDRVDGGKGSPAENMPTTPASP